MSEKVLFRAMKLIIILMGICGIAFDVFLVPLTVAEKYDGTVEELIQWIYQCIISVPCFWILCLAWKICNDMAKGRLFTFENANRIYKSSIALLVSVLVFLIGKVVFFLLGWNRELLIHSIIAVMGITFLIIFNALAHYIRRAAELQEESDLTV